MQFFNVHAIRQLLILQFAMSINKLSEMCTWQEENQQVASATATKSLLARRKSAGGLSYSKEVFAVKVTKKFRKNIELEVFRQTVGHPYLVQFTVYYEALS